MKRVFVFGSNTGGRHGKGSALFALKHHGAVYGCGIGPQGGSYAIPTKSKELKTLPLEVIRGYVEEFLRYAESRPEVIFQVTAIGCGLAGYKPSQIAPMFRGFPQNCELPMEFLEELS